MFFFMTFTQSTVYCGKYKEPISFIKYDYRPYGICFGKYDKKKRKAQ